MASTTTIVACAACRGGPIKCWRCAPSAPRTALSGSDSSGGGRDAVAAVRARSRRQTRSTTSSDGSTDASPRTRTPDPGTGHRGVGCARETGSGTDDGYDAPPPPPPAKRDRRRSSRDDASGRRSEPPADRREIERTLARYVPDDEARARALAAMTPSGQAAREWYNARATETHDLLTSLAASRSLSCPSSSSSTSSSTSSSSSSSRAPSWSRADPLRDVRGAINFCKSVLIGRYVQPRCIVMDLGCGRGQDVAKLAYARPRHVLFVDASESALAEAERRWRRTRFAFPAAFVQDDFCAPDGLLAGRRVIVHRDDPQRAPGQRHHAVPDAECAVPDGADVVDAISCQFAIQHAFATRATALAFVANVRRALRPGGVFVGIVADGACIWELARRRAQTPLAVAVSRSPLRNGLVEHVAADDGDGDNATCCGRDTQKDACADGHGTDGSDGDGSGDDRQHPRRVVLVAPTAPTPVDSVESSDMAVAEAGRSHVPCALGVGAQGAPCPQHTVMFDDLVAMCVDAGLVLMASCDLATFFDIESINPRNASMLDRMRAPSRVDDPDDRQHMGLHRVFAFVRRASPPAAARLLTPTAADQSADGRRPASRARPSGRALSYVWSSDIAA